MIKIVTDESLEDMSEWLTPCCMTGPCSDCRAVKDAVKRGDLKEFCQFTNFWKSSTEPDLEDAKKNMKDCKMCLWFWVDEVEDVDRSQDPTAPLTLEQLREMDGEPVFVKAAWGRMYGIVEADSKGRVYIHMMYAKKLSAYEFNAWSKAGGLAVYRRKPVEWMA